MANQTAFMKTAILAIIVTCMSASAYTQTFTTTNDTAKKIAVQYLGAEEDMMVIGVKYDNLNNSRFVLSIYNEQGEVVFRNAYASSNFSKKFKIPKDHGKLNFIFSGVHDKLSRSYTIHSTSKIIEDMVVTKMN